ncbi:hypothetical protein [Maridesulfovibrio sp.]|uniref:hypothetical protein n=1 Tax=Maridesulfovibrio sp. TaxID=2795000 RepID=UPI0039EE89A5
MADLIRRSRLFTIIKEIRILWIFIILLSPSFLSTKAFCEDLLSNIEISGYVKSLNTVMQPSPLAGLPSGFITSNQQRIDLTGEVRDIDFEVSAENNLIFSEAALSEFDPFTHNSVNRIINLESTIFTDKYSEDKLDIDRLLIRKNFDYGELTVGRQAIGYGRMSMVSPLDVIEPFSPDALDTDTRSGVDAVRATHYFDLGGQLGGSIVLGDEEENNSYLLNFSQNVNGIDILGICGSLRERPMLGAGFATDIGGMGLKAEAVFYIGKDVNQEGGDIHSSFAVGGIEAWYRFENGINFIVEYLYNGAGENDPAKYLEVKSSAANNEGLNAFYGQHYLLFGPSYAFTPLVELKILSFWNILDGSVFARPLLDISVTDNTDVQLFWAMTTGAEPSPATPNIPRSEFGSIGDYGGVYLKYYF